MGSSYKCVIKNDIWLWWNRKNIVLAFPKQALKLIKVGHYHCSEMNFLTLRQISSLFVKKLSYCYDNFWQRLWGQATQWFMISSEPIFASHR